MLFWSKVQQFEAAHPDIVTNVAWSDLKYDGQNALDRLMNVPQELWPSVVDFVHAQRCTLFVMGFATYMMDVRPKLTNKSYVAESVLPIRGVITLDNDVVQHF